MKGDPCSECERPVGKGNKSGFCHLCYPMFQASYQRERVPVKPRAPRQSEKDLPHKDAEYRDVMEKANIMFVQRLALAMVA